MEATAEFRGPGVRHRFEDSGDDYDLDLNQRTRGIGGRSGRIILLGDGTEVLTDSDETEMFDHEEEDKDLDSQVTKGKAKSSEEGRAERGETPGPETAPSIEQSRTPEPIEPNPSVASASSITPSFNTSEGVKRNVKTIPESALPDKIVTPPRSQDKN